MIRFNTTCYFNSKNTNPSHPDDRTVWKHHDTICKASSFVRHIVIFLTSGIRVCRAKAAFHAQLSEEIFLLLQIAERVSLTVSTNSVRLLIAYFPMSGIGEQRLRK